MRGGGALKRRKVQNLLKLISQLIEHLCCVRDSPENINSDEDNNITNDDNNDNDDDDLSAQGTSCE